MQYLIKETLLKHKPYPFFVSEERVLLQSQALSSDLIWGLKEDSSSLEFVLVYCGLVNLSLVLGTVMKFLMSSGYFTKKLLENGKMPSVIMESNVNLEIVNSSSSSCHKDH